MPSSALPMSKEERFLRFYNRQLTMIGLNPLSIDEMHNLLRKISPVRPINGLPGNRSRIYGEQPPQMEDALMQNPNPRGALPLSQGFQAPTMPLMGSTPEEQQQLQQLRRPGGITL